MSNAGRPPVPDAIKSKRDYYRPNSRHKTLKLKPEEISPPEDLPEIGKVTWEMVVECLKGTDTLTKIDALALELLCRSVYLYFKLWEEIHNIGFIVSFVDKEGNTHYKANPAIKAFNSQWDAIYRMLVQFGMTPASRCKITPGKKPENASDLSKILGIQLN